MNVAVKIFLEVFMYLFHFNRFWQRFETAVPGCDCVVHVCEAFTDLYNQIDVYSHCFNNLANINSVIQVI